MRTILIALLAYAAVACSDVQDARIHVYKTPTCGCCTKWVEHLQSNGFEVEVTDLDDLRRLKRDNRVPLDLAACHTAIVDGYVVEGHVPAEDVRKLLRERPEAVGIAVAGMPEGSPGMEGPNPESYDVMLFGPSGSRVFSSHAGAE